MKANSRSQRARSLYAAAWQYAGPGMLIVLMFVIVAAAAMFREQTAVANLAGAGAVGRLDFDDGSNDLDLRQRLSISHSVRLTLPLNQLRDSDGRMTPNGESLLLLLARRMKSLSLSVMLTINSMHDAEFAATIAAHMLRDASLKSTQLRISFDAIPTAVDASGDSVLTVTMTRHEMIDGDAK
ncbi:MAG: hypothetical protein WKF77_02885 [Planctomycetaceae bacterium]